MSNFQEQVHHQICKNLPTVLSWFQEEINKNPFPIYSSYDIRDSNFKIANVDANIYPAGFNNICNTDLDAAPSVLKKYLNKHYPLGLKKIALITEEHSKNPYYWHNISTLKKIFQGVGLEVELAFAGALEQPIEVESIIGEKLKVYSADPESSDFLADFKPDLLISNNDFSDEKAQWANKISIPINPPRELGWYRRKKSNYFKFYNEVVAAFSNIIGVDPFNLQVKTEIFTDYNVSDDANNQKLAQRIDGLILELKQIYEKKQIDHAPFVYIKNNSGTYGLGVIKVNSGEDYLNLNYQNRKKMKAAKGGKGVSEVILQEGIPSIVKDEIGTTAEPVIYMLGGELAGGFLRTHSSKSETESLNSPGAVYKRLCVSDLAINTKGCPNENVYGWSAKLGLLAIALEAQMLSVNFTGFEL